jgi:hypothetical protein
VKISSCAKYLIGVRILLFTHFSDEKLGTNRLNDMLNMQRNQDKPRPADTRLVCSHALHTLPACKNNKKLEKNSSPLAHLPGMLAVNGDIILLALLVGISKGQAPLAGSD